MGLSILQHAAGTFERRVNPDTLLWQRLASPHWEGELRAILERHVAETGSRHAAMILNDWATQRDAFWQVVPKEYAKYLPRPMSEVPQAAE